MHSVNKLLKNNDILKILIILTFISILFLPNIFIFRPEDITIIAITLIIFFKDNLKISFPARHKYYLSLFIIYIIWIIISIILNNTYNQLSELFEIIKIIKALLIFLIFYRLFPIYKETIEKTLLWSFWALVIINLIHFFDLFHINDIIEKVYTSERNIDSLRNELSASRITGLMSNPNNNAILFIFFICHFITKLIYTKLSLLPLITAIIMTILCQSRSAFIALGVMFFILFFIYLKLNIKYIIYGLLFITIVLLVSPHIDDRYYRYITSIWEIPIEENTSLAFRIYIWDYLINLLDTSNHMLIGFANKNFLYSNEINTDSLYIFILFQYGLIGISIYVALLLIPLIQSFIYKNQYTMETGLFIIVIIIAGLLNHPLGSQTLLTLTFFLIGAGYSTTDYIKLLSNKNDPKKKGTNNA